ncbi:MAG: OsmC family peroxiredoxin [Burkholderiales bacterium]|nr:MAG: OsmC family peroxiredoxin [Burkholderiales bacterium]
MADGERFIRLEQLHDFRIAITWDETRPPIVGDEPPPLGTGEGPNPSQLLLAAVASCMTDSLFFALRKFALDASPLSTEARAEVGRNAEGRQRVLALDIRLALGRLPEDEAKLTRALAQFEQFCTVGQSVAQGIATRVTVRAPDGRVLHGAAE